MPLPLKLKSTLATACHIVGLGLAVYLALLKYYALPCVGPGRCQEILYSKYGTVFDVPVGVFGAALWLGIILVRDRGKRDLLLVMLALGTALFMVVQFFVLRGFCIYCTAHAVAAWGALLLHHERRRLWTPLVAFALAAAGFFAARQYADARAQGDAVQYVRLAGLPDKISALPWLGAIHPRSPALILSLDCAACLDLLEELSRSGFRNRDAGPAIFFKTTDVNLPLTEAFVAAVLSQGELSRRDALFAATTVLLMEKGKALSDPDAAANRLAALFPAAEEKREDAAKILAAQHKALTAAKVGDTTPLLVSRNGHSRAIFEAADVFP